MIWAPELLYSAVYHLDAEILINSGWYVDADQQTDSIQTADRQQTDSRQTADTQQTHSRQTAHRQQTDCRQTAHTQ